MKISIKNFEKNISKAFLTAGKNNFDTNKVREFDEDTKGNFVAFVDDGAESYDVNITIDEKQNILSHHCDCKEEYLFCAHQIAVLYQLQLGAKSTAVKIPKAKKKTPSELLLETVSPEALKTFLSETFITDKILELKFVQYFANYGANISIEEAKKNLDTARKTVVKNKKKIEKTDLTQIVNLCNPIVLNFVKQVDINIQIATIKDVFELVNYYENILNSFIINSNLPEKTIEKIALEKFKFIDKVDDAITKEAIKLLAVKSIFSDKGYKVNQLKSFVAYLKEKPSDEVFLLLTLLKLEMRHISSSVKGFSHLQDSLLPLVIEKQIFVKLKQEFTTLPFDNAHNKLLIDGLIEIEDYQLAETYCTTIINSNYLEKYNTAYYKKLIKIYEKINNPAKQLACQIKVCIEEPTFEDYESITNKLLAIEAKRDFVKKVNNTIMRYIYDLKYETMYLKVQLNEQAFTSVFNRLEKTKTLLHFTNNFDILYDNNPKKLLEILLSRKKAYAWEIDQEEHKDGNYYDALCKLIKDNYSQSEFRDIYIAWANKKPISELGLTIKDYMIIDKIK